MKDKVHKHDDDTDKIPTDENADMTPNRQQDIDQDDQAKAQAQAQAKTGKSILESYSQNPPKGSVDHKKLFELVSKNYETWSSAMSKKLQEEENYSPFPNEDEETSGTKDDSAFNFSLLEALEKASSDYSDNINKLNSDEVFNQIQTKMESLSESIGSLGDKVSSTNKKVVPTEVSVGSKPKGKRIDKTRPEALLKESEMEFLRNKISQMIQSSDFSLNPEGHRANRQEGFSLYDTKDEEGLHEGNANGYDDEYDYDDQDDYDIEEINDDDYQYKYPPTHHIELELNAPPQCDEHGYDGCDCPAYDSMGEAIHGYDDDGPSCEFTFEYDHTGKLVPVYNNVEEKLRMLSLESRGDVKLPPISDLNIGSSSQSNESKNKKKNKKKKKKGTKTNEQPPNAQPSPHCLFCEYESIFGSKPRQLIKWYEQRNREDAQRREDIKKKLANAKQKAIKKQRELRQRQLEESQEL